MAGPPPSENLWIGGLPVGLDNDMLRERFSAYGTIVDCRVLPPKADGMKAGAMIRFESLDEATWLVENMNGNLPEGFDEPVIVRYANAPGSKWAGIATVPFNGAGGACAGGGKAGAHWKAGWTMEAAQQKLGKGAPTLALQPAAGQVHGAAAFAGPLPSANLWIGGLPTDMDNETLREVFGAYGSVVDCRVLPPKAEGMKAGAMVRFEALESAAWLVENMNGQIMEGLDEPVIVRYANAPGNKWAGAAPVLFDGAGGACAGGGKNAVRPAPYGGKGGCVKGNVVKGALVPMPPSFGYLLKAVSDSFGAISAPKENQVYVSNLPPDTTDLDLYKLFAPFGALAPNGVRAMMHPNGSCKGIGFVDFVQSSGADIAVQELNGFQCPDGSQIQCSIKAASRGKGKAGMPFAE